MMICTVQGQSEYEDVFTWDMMVGDLDTKTVVIPKIGVLASSVRKSGIAGYTQCCPPSFFALSKA